MRRSLITVILALAACGNPDGGGGNPTPAPTGGSSGDTSTGGAVAIPTGGGGGTTSTAPSGGSSGGADAGGPPGETTDAATAPPASDGGGAATSDGGPTAPPAGGSLAQKYGLTPIFDGTTLNGWTGSTAIWKVKDGAIDGLTQNGGQLLKSMADYDSFRIMGMASMPQSTNHLGICFWGSRAGNGYGGCIDFVPPSGSIWDYLTNKGIRTYPYVWMGKPVSKTDWHQFEILADIKTGKVRMGVDGHEFPVYMDAAGTLGRRQKGPIGLQIHAGFSEVEYKDLCVDTAPKEDKLLSTTGDPTMPM
jgi:hypothetical protein